MTEEKMRAALEAAITALNDWTATIAPEYCDEQAVKQAQRRLQKDGTLYYIATTLEQCKEALNDNENRNEAGQPA